MAKGKYQALTANDNNNINHNDAPDTIRRPYIVTGLYICAWVLSLLMVYHYRIPMPKFTTYTYNDFDDRTFECGTTVSEAKVAGCEFDPVTFLSLPERCLDRELAAELLGNTTWTVHADPAATIPKSVEEFAANDTLTFITSYNHLIHCVYGWKRMHRLLLAGKPYPSTMAYVHTHHYGEIILDAAKRPHNEVRNTALVQIPAC